MLHYSLTFTNCSEDQFSCYTKYLVYYVQLYFITTPKNDKLPLTLFNKVISQLFSTEGVSDPA